MQFRNRNSAVRCSLIRRLAAPAFALGFLIGVTFVPSPLHGQSGTTGLKLLNMNPEADPEAPPLVRENSTLKLTGHTYVIPDNAVGLVPNVGIIVGSRATLVIDPGVGRTNVDRVLREVAKVSKNKQVYCAGTHFHSEHAMGCSVYPASVMKYISSKTQNEELAETGEDMIEHGRNSPRNAPFLKDLVLRKADITFDKDYSLDLGGVHVKFLVVGPDETRGDTVMLVQEDKVLFTGEAVTCGWFPWITQDSNLKAWFAALDTVDAMQPQIIIPSHGPMGPRDIIATERKIFTDIQARVGALKAQGQGNDEIIKAVYAEVHAQYPEYHRTNGLTTIIQWILEETR
jgi:glyoxylase-like metal-dependent hydrolase (beta-lactamase superfamily II)